MENYYQDLGVLVLGSRLRRMSERMLAEIAAVYKNTGIDFEAGWFHILFLLNQRGEMSITEIADTLQMAHPSVIQVTKAMEKKELISAHPGKEDKRKRMLLLSTKGRALLIDVMPVWESIREKTDALLQEGPHSAFLLEALNELEENLNKRSLAQRMPNATEPKA